MYRLCYLLVDKQDTQLQNGNPKSSLGGSFHVNKTRRTRLGTLSLAPVLGTMVANVLPG